MLPRRKMTKVPYFDSVSTVLVDYLLLDMQSKHKQLLGILVDKDFEIDNLSKSTNLLFDQLAKNSEHNSALILPQLIANRSSLNAMRPSVANFPSLGDRAIAKLKEAMLARLKHLLTQVEEKIDNLHLAGKKAKLETEAFHSNVYNMGMSIL